MLGNFDNYGWVRGALHSMAEKNTHRAALPTGTKNYAWTLFRPDSGTFGTRSIGRAAASQPSHRNLQTLRQAAEAFDHVRKGRPGRAVLIQDIERDQ